MLVIKGVAIASLILMSIAVSVGSTLSIVAPSSVSTSYTISSSLSKCILSNGADYLFLWHLLSFDIGGHLLFDMVGLLLILYRYSVNYLKGINLRENLFREWIFSTFCRKNFREWGHFKYFARIYLREWSNFLFFFNFFFSIKKDVKCIRMEKILKKLIFVNKTCSFTSYQTEITSFIIIL